MCARRICGRILRRSPPHNARARRVASVRMAPRSDEPALEDSRTGIRRQDEATPASSSSAAKSCRASSTGGAYKSTQSQLRLTLAFPKRAARSAVAAQAKAAEIRCASVRCASVGVASAVAAEAASCAASRVFDLPLPGHLATSTSAEVADAIISILS